MLLAKCGIKIGSLLISLPAHVFMLVYLRVVRVSAIKSNLMHIYTPTHTLPYARTSVREEQKVVKYYATAAKRVHSKKKKENNKKYFLLPSLGLKQKPKMWPEVASALDLRPHTPQPGNS